MMFMLISLILDKDWLQTRRRVEGFDGNYGTKLLSRSLGEFLSASRFKVKNYS